MATLFAFASASGCGVTDPLSGNNVNVPTSINLPNGDVTIKTIIGSNLMMFATVRINDQGPFTFVIDTGASATTVTSRVGDLFPDAVIGTGTASAGTGTGSVQVPLLQLDKLTLGTVTFENFQSAVVELASVFQGLNFTVDGIIGLPMFRQLAVTFDFKNQSIRLRTGTLPETDNCKILPLQLNSESLITMPVEVLGTTLQALIDTGNNSFLHVPSNVNVTFAGPTQTATIATITGTFNVLKGCLAPNAVKIGCYPVANPCVNANAPLANLGVGAFNPFLVTIDQRTLRIAFQPQS